MLTAVFPKRWYQTKPGEDWSKARENPESGQFGGDIMWMLPKKCPSLVSKPEQNLCVEAFKATLTVLLHLALTALGKGHLSFQVILSRREDMRPVT